MKKNQLRLNEALTPNSITGESGVAGSRLITALAVVGIITGVLYTGSEWGNEFFRVKRGEACTKNIEMIQEAKLKFRLRYKYEEPQRYSDMMPFLDTLNFPSCPFGGEYLNSLKMKQEARCPHNGDPALEPITPGIDPKTNGYHDLGPKPKAETLIGFLGKKLWESMGAMSYEEERRRKDQLFLNSEESSDNEAFD